MAAVIPSVQERVEREVKAYDQGEVFARSLRLQTRFQHVFFGPNTKWLLD